MKKSLPLPICWRKSMKMTGLPLLILILLNGLALATNIRAQTVLDTKVTIHLQNQDVKTILALIEEQTKVKFLYSTSFGRNAETVAPGVRSVGQTDHSESVTPCFTIDECKTGFIGNFSVGGSR
jgi:hypothetical protein